jgi:hypothetical protein
MKWVLAICACVVTSSSQFDTSNYNQRTLLFGCIARVGTESIWDHEYQLRKVSSAHTQQQLMDGAEIYNSSKHSHNMPSSIVTTTICHIIICHIECCAVHPSP